MNKIIDLIKKTGSRPITVSSLKKDFSRLGLKAGMTVIVHSSMSSLGWVCGGPVAVIQAIEEVLTEEGTLVMPAHSSDNSEPSRWVNPPVPESWFEPIRGETPAFDMDFTPTAWMGKIAETFRKQPGVLRSDHPLYSFCAWGKHKEKITANVPLDFAMGKGSPLERIYELDGKVLLIGVGHENNTSLHLAEHLVDYPGKKFKTEGSAVRQKGERVWIEFEDIEYNDNCFEELGKAFTETGKEIRGRVGLAECRFMNQREAVDFAGSWLMKHGGTRGD